MIPLVCIPSLINIKMWSGVISVWTNKTTMQRAPYSSLLSALTDTQNDESVPFECVCEPLSVSDSTGYLLLLFIDLWAVMKYNKTSNS